jgi:hypothetical protein
MRWWLLLHQIPPKPPYLRAKILRRLNQLGSLPVKNSAYLLPASDAALEDLQWTAQQIRDEGGDAWLFRVEALAGLHDESIREAFREMRRPDYVDLIAAARKLAERPDEAEWKRLNQKLADVRRIDFFDAPGHDEMGWLMSTIDRTLHPSRVADARPSLEGLRGRTWVTRRGAKVDRIGSAWLIRRFIDPDARFEFVDPADYAHSPDHLRFDMFEGEFTHEGERCTFEVLLAALGAPDPALTAIAEIVHDLDLRDSKFQRPEAIGVAAMIEGIVRGNQRDHDRLTQGVGLFDALYASFGGR